jgi:hypothetical protein
MRKKIKKAIPVRYHDGLSTLRPNAGGIDIGGRSESIDLCWKLLGMAPLVRSSDSAPPNPSWLCPRCQAPLIVILRLTAAELYWRLSSNSFADSS